MDDVELMRQILSMPKIELHRHLTGSIDSMMAIRIATKYQVPLPTYLSFQLDELLFGNRTVRSLPEYFNSWKILNRLFTSCSAVRDIIMEVVREASEDNIIYLELRTGPHGFLGKDSYSFEEFINAFSAGAIEAENKFGVIVRCILGIPRHVFVKVPSPQRNTMFRSMISIMESVRSVFVGVDLNGDERAAPGQEFDSLFRIAQERGFGITVHAGETGPISNVEHALRSAGAARIGHGLAAVRDPKVLSEIAERNVALEICPTSNEILGLIPDPRALPLNILDNYGITYVICSDNPARNRVSLSEELFKVASAFSYSENRLQMLLQQTIDKSFADKNTKKAIESKIKGYSKPLLQTTPNR
jgi:adenosine deaminase